MILFTLLFWNVLVQNENYYSKLIAEKISGKSEYRLVDGSRVDILVDDYAIEVDWANKSLKWAEAIGQAKYYAKMTKRRPAVILLFTDISDKKQLANFYKCIIASGNEIQVWYYLIDGSKTDIPFERFVKK